MYFYETYLFIDFSVPILLIVYVTKTISLTKFILLLDAEIPSI
jgi:hypothetical protein